MTAGALWGGAVIDWLVWSIPLAGLAQLALTWRAAALTGFPLRPKRPRWTPLMSLPTASVRHREWRPYLAIDEPASVSTDGNRAAM